jgi:hypothetical protein
MLSLMAAAYSRIKTTSALQAIKSQCLSSASAPAVCAAVQAQCSRPQQPLTLGTTGPDTRYLSTWLYPASMHKQDTKEIRERCPVCRYLPQHAHLVHYISPPCEVRSGSHLATLWENRVALAGFVQSNMQYGVH